VQGPAIVEEPACTTVVCPDQEAVADRFSNLIITEVTP
jgi:N-methylhydantoinase A/oxoprolinase/acetone carboxylase beta subunit